MTGATNERTSFSDRVRWLWREGIARRIVVEKGPRRPIDIPLTVFLVAAVLAPWLVAIGGVVAILMGYQFRVDRDPEETPVAPPEAAPGMGDDGAGL
jgi:hypothetical protein